MIFPRGEADLFLVHELPNGLAPLDSWWLSPFICFTGAYLTVALSASHSSRYRKPSRGNDCILPKLLRIRLSYISNFKGARAL